MLQSRWSFLSALNYNECGHDCMLITFLEGYQSISSTVIHLWMNIFLEILCAFSGVEKDPKIDQFLINFPNHKMLEMIANDSFTDYFGVLTQSQALF